jgi:nitrogen-specific signal transduction histidine kinase
MQGASPLCVDALGIDERGRVVAWNLGAERLLGYSGAQMRGTDLDRIIPAHSRGRNITEQRRGQVQAALVRHAAVTANSADTFGAAATAVVREVCEQLGGLADQAWTTDEQVPFIRALAYGQPAEADLTRR